MLFCHSLRSYRGFISREILKMTRNIGGIRVSPGISELNPYESVQSDCSILSTIWLGPPTSPLTKSALDVRGLV